MDIKEKAKFYSLKVREILINEWDPIGVWATPEAQDEYDSYVPQICGLLMKAASKEAVFEHLWHIETAHMELAATPAGKERTQHVVQKLMLFANDYEVLHS